MKVRITGASNFVNRMFEACGSYQWAREFLKNALEAQATKIEFGVEWQAVKHLGKYRRTIIDNGIGMDSKELLEFFSTLGAGAKKIGGIHDNFGVGAKIASLPWNPEGVVIISYKAGKASMIWIVLDDDSGDYELVDFKIGGNTSCVVDPTELAEDEDGINWGEIRPSWLKDHGTIAVLLGSTQYPDTIMGNPDAGENDIKGLSVYLNTRFWDLSKVDTKVVELRSEKKSQWPEGPDDRDDARRPNNRQVMGARYYLSDVKAPKGKLAYSGKLTLESERVDVEWFLWEGERPAIHSYAKKSGYIAVRYNDELFQLTMDKVRFRWFGIIESKVQQNLTLIITPQHYQASNGRWGIHADQSRNRLIFTGNGEKGVEIPLSEWAFEFVGKLPTPILEAIRAARGEIAGSIDDPEYRKRLQDKFGSRWTMKAYVKARDKDRDKVGVTVSNEDVEVEEERDSTDGTRHRKKKRTVKVVRKKAQLGGPDDGVLRDVAVDVPKYRFSKRDVFQRPWHLACWAPNDPMGPTVLLNEESPILEEIVRHHQEQYPDAFSDEVRKEVWAVFGEIAACKIAHSQKLTRDVPEQELDQDYRSEKALTVALMGLLAEETVISQRLGRLGRKKAPV